VILFRDAPHSISPIRLAQHCEKYLDDTILLSTPCAVQSIVSPNAFTNFMKILGGFEPPFSHEIFDNLMSLAREFGYNGLITNLAPQQDAFRREERNTIYQKNATGETEAQQSKTISSSIAICSLSCNATCQRSQKDSTESLKESCRNMKR
jgi:hypothetical protein